MSTFKKCSSLKISENRIKGFKKQMKFRGSLKGFMRYVFEQKKGGARAELMYTKRTDFDFNCLLQPAISTVATLIGITTIIAQKVSAWLAGQVSIVFLSILCEGLCQLLFWPLKLWHQSRSSFH